MAGFYYIGTKTGKLYHLGVCGNPDAMVRQIISKLKRNHYDKHPFLHVIQNQINNGDEYISGSMDIVNAEEDSLEMKKAINDRHIKMESMGYINVLDIRNPENEYPNHLKRILKKTKDVLEQGLVSVDDFENFLDNIQ